MSSGAKRHQLFSSPPYKVVQKSIKLFFLVQSLSTMSAESILKLKLFLTSSGQINTQYLATHSSVVYSLCETLQAPSSLARKKGTERKKGTIRGKKEQAGVSSVSSGIWQAIERCYTGNGMLASQIEGLLKHAIKVKDKSMERCFLFDWQVNSVICLSVQR